MLQPTTEITYHCEVCGHTQTLPPDEPVPECCDLPMTEANPPEEEG